MLRTNYLGTVWCTQRVPAGPRRRLARRQRRLGRGHGRRRAVLGVEARAARVLALGRRRARAPRDLGAHGQPGLRRDARLPAAGPASGSARERLVVDPELVVERTLARRRARPTRDLRAALVRAGSLAAGALPGALARARARFGHAGAERPESTTTRRARVGPVAMPRRELVGDRAGDAGVLLERHARPDDRDRRARAAARGRARRRTRPSRSSRRRGRARRRRAPRCRSGRGGSRRRSRPGRCPIHVSRSATKRRP